MDVTSLFKKGVEKQLLDVDDYIFTPERIDMVVDEGNLNCVLNSDGSVNIFYSKEGITDVRAAARKHPFTDFDTELHHGIYDDVIEDLIDGVNEIINSHSKYFRMNKVLPMTAALGDTDLISENDKY
ncbi:MULTISPECIES: hypothetical protein [unclassified Psychrobacter]|uniref:hypothetical protein n=1 Tax=unclassified Psychrobacter TaxID=196806 RepID=UPI00293D62A6|nr:hypothetical protein [uncultured Psychrobacter sp.]